MSTTSPNVAGQPAEIGTPLRHFFSDLFALALLFRETCETRTWTPTELRERYVALIEAQERRARGGEVSWESYQEARFAILAWVDELVLTSPWPSRGQWQHLMLTYHGTLNAGDQFFERLERLPGAARDIREIYYFCLALGFEGKFAVGESPAALRELRRTLYNQLSAGAGSSRWSEARLFPEAYRRPPPPAPQASQGWGVLWLSLIAATPVILFLLYLLVLRSAADARIAALLETPPRATTAPAPEWRRSLVEELRGRGIDAREEARGIVITLPGVSFEVNRSDLSSNGERSVRQVAAALLKYAPERIAAVEGHASREKGTLDEQNQRLSADRAQRVAEALLSAGLRQDRVTARGLGSSTPVDSNDTEEGRRRNRRVEIIVEKTGN